jgi:hypothetical protein
MRVLVGQPAAGDQHAGIDERRDDRLVGVALLAFVGDDALAGEARRVLGESAILVDRVGDRGLDPARCQHQLIGNPDFKILRAVPRRGVDETGAGLLGDMLAFEEGNSEIVTHRPQRMSAFEVFKLQVYDFVQFPRLCDPRGFHYLVSETRGDDQLFAYSHPRLSPVG